MAASTSKIKILPEQLINKIAAGEVVERPASIVKELTENAVDAGATQILISIKNGGKDFISILDNGSGMNEDDAQLAIERHATSKIIVEDDLEKIDTLGFRGEALASIASVSEFELLTCHDEQKGAIRLFVKGGILDEVGKTGFPKGTKITIQKLFYNTPARLKFMKTTTTEFRHIQETVVHQALANPHIQFRLTHNNQVVLSLARGQDLEQRIYQLFNDDFPQGLHAVDHEETSLRYKGFLSLPSQSKMSKKWQYLFVNDRFVKCPSVSRAIYAAYRKLLGNNQHPVFFLKLYMDPSDIDVNVHPAKTEIRIRNTRLIHTIMEEHLHQSVMDASHRRHFSSALIPSGEPRAPKKPAIPLQEQLEMSIPEKFSLEAPVKRKPATPSAPKTAKAPKASKAPQMPKPSKASKVVDFPSSSRKTYEKREPAPKNIKSSVPDEPMVAEQSAEGGLGTFEQSLPLLGQWKKNYVVSEKDGQLILIDQHTADEFRLFSQYQKEFQAGQVRTKHFEVPVLLDLSPQNAVLLDQYLAPFQRLGFVIESFGKNTYSIRDVPELLPEKVCKETILAILDELVLFGKSGRMEQVNQHALEKVACYAAVQSGDTLSRKEMSVLVTQLEEPEVFQFRPHGKAVCIELTEDELEKRFKRI